MRASAVYVSSRKNPTFSKTRFVAFEAGNSGQNVRYFSGVSGIATVCPSCSIPTSPISSLNVTPSNAINPFPPFLSSPPPTFFRRSFSTTPRKPSRGCGETKLLLSWTRHVFEYSTGVSKSASNVTVGDSIYCIPSTMTKLIIHPYVQNHTEYMYFKKGGSTFFFFFFITSAPLCQFLASSQQFPRRRVFCSFVRSLVSTTFPPRFYSFLWSRSWLQVRRRRIF